MQIKPDIRLALLWEYDFETFYWDALTNCN